jgi:hypothetical protein
MICFRGRLDCPAERLREYPYIVLDEVHTLTTRIGIAGILSTRPGWILAVTATPGQRNAITEKFVGKCELKGSSKKIWHVGFPRFISGLKEEDFRAQSAVVSYSLAISALAECPRFITWFKRVILYYHSLQQRVIIITMRLNMNQALAKAFDEHNQSLLNQRKRVSYAILDSDNDTCGNVDVIIGTNKCMGVGFDLKNSIKNFDGREAEIVIVMGSFHDPTLAEQIAGRSFRGKRSVTLFPEINDLKVSVKHARLLKEHCEKMQGCIRLDDEYIRFLESFNIPEALPPALMEFD